MKVKESTENGFLDLDIHFSIGAILGGLWNGCYPTSDMKSYNDLMNIVVMVLCL